MNSADTADARGLHIYMRVARAEISGSSYTWLLQQNPGTQVQNPSHGRVLTVRSRGVRCLDPVLLIIVQVADQIQELRGGAGWQRGL